MRPGRGAGNWSRATFAPGSSAPSRAHAIFTDDPVVSSASGGLHTPATFLLSLRDAAHSARPVEQKKGADGGVDGNVFFRDHPDAKAKQQGLGF